MTLTESIQRRDNALTALFVALVIAAMTILMSFRPTANPLSPEAQFQTSLSRFCKSYNDARERDEIDIEATDFTRTDLDVICFKFREMRP